MQNRSWLLSGVGTSRLLLIQNKGGTVWHHKEEAWEEAAEEEWEEVWAEAEAWALVAIAYALTVGRECPTREACRVLK